MTSISHPRLWLPTLLAAVASALICTNTEAQVGTDWRRRSPQPWGDTLTSVVKTDSRIIAVGPGAEVMQSTDDGATWSAQQIVPNALFREDIVTVAWNGLTGSSSKLIFASDNGLWTSKDGDVWTAQTTDLAVYESLSNILHTASGWVALQRHQSGSVVQLRLVNSTDGEHWTIASTLPASSPLIELNIVKLIDTGTGLVAVGWEHNTTNGSNLGALLSTTDGVTWTSKVFTDGAVEAQFMTDVTLFGTILVAVGNNREHGFSYTSTNGVSWSRHDADGAQYVVATSTHLIATSNGWRLTSTDGASWTPDLSAEAGLDPRAMIWDGTQVIAAGSSGVVYFASADGSTWTRKTPPAPLQDFDGLAVSPTGVLVASDPQYQVYRSVNGGDSWSKVTAEMWEIMYGAVWDTANTRFVSAAGQRFGTSDANGLSWSSTTFFNPDWMTCIAANGGTIVVGGDDFVSGSGALYRSTDNGVSWTKITLPAGTKTLRTLAHVGSQFIAGGDRETLLTSPDGAVWTKRTLVSSNGMNILAIAGNGSLIVAMGEAGGNNFYTSTNGVTWIKRVLSTYHNIHSVIWTGTNFVATGVEGTALNSNDGINWTPRYTGTNNDLDASVWDGSQMVAVGDAGIVMTSDTVPVASFAGVSESVFESDGTTPVQVVLSLPSTSPVTIPINTSGTTDASDFTAPASVTFAAGETSKVINIIITDDPDAEPTETLQLTLGTAAGVRIGGTPTHTISINDNDSTPEVNFMSTSTIVNEHVGQVCIGVMLSSPTPAFSSIQVSFTLGGTMDASDYTVAPSSPISFSSGKVVTYITVTINDDADVETDETLTITLDPPGSATLGSDTVFTLVVKDNDPGTDPARRWTLRQPGQTADTMNAIVNMGSRQVIIGDGVDVLTSDNNGVSWSRHFTGALGRTFSSGTYDGKQAIAVGKGGAFMISPNGTSWANTKMPGADNGMELNSVTSNNTRTVAVGSFFDGNGHAPLIYTTMDGVHWRREITPFGAMGQLQGVTWTGSQFVAVGFDSQFDPNTSKSLPAKPLILTSPEGRIWTNRSGALTTAELWSVMWTGTQIVAFDETKSHYTSADGIAWTKRATGTLGSIAVAAYSPTKMAGVGTVTATSTDGTTWTQRASPTKNEFNDIVWTGANFIALSRPSGIYTSPDGITWTRRSTGVENPFPLLGSVWTGTQFVAVGGDSESGGSALIATSPDGFTWTQRSTAVPTVLTRVAWNGSMLVAVGGRGVIMTSVDGVAWTPRSSGVTLNLFGIVWAGNQFVAVGGNEEEDNDLPTGPVGSVVLTSPNGIAWTRRMIPTSQPLNDVAWDGSLFVAVGRSVPNTSGPSEKAEVLTSTDAIIWTHRDSQLEGHDLQGVSYNGAQWVAVGEGANAVHSADGITWAEAGSMPAFPDGADPGFYGVLWVTDHWVAVGDYGIVMTSLDGDAWDWAPSELSSGPLVGLAWNGQTLVATGWNGSVQTSGPQGAQGTPTVTFVTSGSTVSEDAGIERLLVTMTPAPTSKITLPYTIVAGSPGMILTGASADVTVQASPLIFNPGESSKFITVTVKDDVLDETNESLEITLNPGVNALPGGRMTRRVTITDNDTPVSTTAMGEPVPQLLKLNDALTLSVDAVGSPPLKYQWKKNGISIAGATSKVFYVAKVALTHAGTYTCVISNPVGSLTSDPAEVGVYEALVKNNAAIAATNAVLTQGVGGNGITLAWYKDGSPTELPPSTHVVYDATKKTLTLKAPLVDGTDGGQYVCKVTHKGSRMTVPANTFNIDVITAKPTIDAATVPDPLPNGAIGQSYYQDVNLATGSAEASTWSATGLPSGLSINAVTGEISGYPTVAATNKVVTISAANGNGSTSRATKITVLGLPAGMAGSSYGLIERQSAVNDNLAGKIQMTITTTGSFTGAYTWADGSVQSFTGQTIVDSPTTAHGATTFYAGGKIVRVTFTYDSSVEATGNSGTGTVEIEVPGTGVNQVANIKTWRAHAAPVAYAGKDTFAIHLQAAQVGDQSVPQGIGYGTATITATGTATFAGKLGDGTAYTQSSFIARDGRSPLWVSLYAGKGSFMMTPLFTLGGAPPTFPETTLSDLTDASWRKNPDTSTAGARNYPSGFATLSLDVKGSEYKVPDAGKVVLNMSYTSGTDNAVLTFSEGGIADTLPAPDISVNIRPMPSSSVDPIPATSNPRKTTLTINGTTGAISGSFTLVDEMPNHVPLTRTVIFTGVIVRYGAVSDYEGVGVFSLPQLPSSSVSPMPAPTTTPILAGRLELWSKPG